MKDSHNELISAYLDREASDSESHQSLEILARSPEFRERLGRYQLIGAILRMEPLPESNLEFSKQLHQAIRREFTTPAEDTRTTPVWLRWWRPAVPAFGLAATLALAIGLSSWFLGFPGLNPNPITEASNEAMQFLHSMAIAHAEGTPSLIPPFEYEAK